MISNTMEDEQGNMNLSGSFCLNYFENSNLKYYDCMERSRLFTLIALPLTLMVVLLDQCELRY
jgi:hypothetical protein